LQAARALLTPRTHWRKHRRLRRTASGRSLAYNLRFPGQYYQAETGLNQNVNRDYDPLIGKYIESDPMGIEAGINTFTYARNYSIGLIDPDGLCPSVFDTGIAIRAIWRDKCILKGHVAHYEGQDRYQFVGPLVGQEGNCSCGLQTEVCIYSVVLNQSERRTPCGGGAFSPWGPLTGGRPMGLRATVDCKTGKFDLGSIGINLSGPSAFLQ
jgi:RHS repeat-associated protein